MRILFFSFFLSCFVPASFLRAGPMDDFLSLESRGVHHDIVLISHEGKLVYQFYGRGYHENSRHLSWSIAKTIAGILVAQASEEFKFSLTDPVSRFVPDFRGTARIIDLLQMSSAIDFAEQYSGVPVSADVVRMLYLEGAERGTAGYVKSLGFRDGVVPGDHFYYSSGDTNLLMEVLKNVIADQQKYDDYPWKKIFRPLGIHSAVMEQDSQKIFVGSSYLYLTGPDFLKIGQLLAADGLWNGRRLIPASYVRLMHDVAPGVKLGSHAGGSASRAYSAQVTTNLPMTKHGVDAAYPMLPPDTLILLGHQGQLMAASPGAELVIVRLGLDQGTAFRAELFFQTALAELAAQSRFLRSIKPDRRASGELKKTVEEPLTARHPAPAPQPAAPQPAVASRSLVESKFVLLDYLKVPRLIRRYTAKEYCSCRFVVGRSDEMCRLEIGFSMPILPKIIIKPDQSVTTRFFVGDEDHAFFKSEMLGCGFTRD